MLYETSVTRHTRAHLSSTCASPVFLSSQFTFQNCEHATPRKVHPGPQVHCQQEQLEIGSAPSQLLLRQLSYMLHVKHTGQRTVASASPGHFSGVHSFEQQVYCAPRGLEEWHRCLGVRGFLPWQNDVSGHCSVAPGPSQASKAFRSMACPWPRGDAHCHNAQ